MLAKHSESFSLVELPWKFPIAIAAILLLIYEGRFLDLPAQLALREDLGFGIPEYASAARAPWF